MRLARAARRAPWQLALGALIVGAIVAASLAAPLLTSHDPLREWHLRWFGDRYLPAPFEPSGLYPLGSDQLGRDIWANLLYGARLTLGIALLVLVARLAVGVTLGAVAGWFAHRWPDRLISLAIDAFAAFPTLLFAILWILAFDIRAGASSFVLALAITGWWAFGRTMRSALVALRGAAYLEAAESLGLSSFAVVVRHVLPNVLPLLAVTAALDTAAVVLALGELGFLGFVVGGGQSVFVNDTGAARTLFFGAPEWGGLVAQGRFQWQSHWWIAVFPSLAFAATILGFNLLGHGLRALLDRSPIGLAGLFRWRVAALAAGAVVVLQVAVPRLGPAAALAPVADTFDAVRAKADLAYIADPARGGRLTASSGYAEAAAFVADRFRELGLRPLGDDGTYFQHVPTDVVELTAMPILELTAPSRETFRVRDDFSEIVGSHAGAGDVDAPVVFAGGGAHSKGYSDYANVDARGKIVMVLPGLAGSENVWENALKVGAAGVIFLDAFGTPTAPPPTSFLKYSYIAALEKDVLPTVHVTLAVADRLFAASGRRTVEDVVRPAVERFTERLKAISLGRTPPDPTSFDTGVRVHLAVPVGPIRHVDGVNVVGLLPQSVPTDRERYVVVGGHLDGIGTDPDGTVYPAANDNGSGPAITIEVARVVAKERDRLRAGVIFVAFCGEEQGLRCSDAFAQRSITTAYRPENVGAFLDIDVAGCCGDVLGATDESFALHARLASAADRHGVAFGYVARGASDHQSFLRRGVPAVMLAWTDFGPLHTTRDTAATVDVEHLRKAGVVASQAILELAVVE